MKFTDMKLSHQFSALLIIIIAGFSIYGLWSFKTLNALKVNGPTYQRIVQDKDLIADILPPPEYIIESYLVSLQAMSASPSNRQPLIDNLKTLKSDYDTRRAFWIKENLDDKFKTVMDSADKSAQAFYQIAFDQFIPALVRNDASAADQALNLMKQHYAAHRIDINKTVELATKSSATDEANAKAEISDSTMIMLMILVAVMGIAGLMLWLVTRNLIRQLGGEPKYAVEIASRIAAGDLATTIDIETDNRSSLLFAIAAMRDSLAHIVGQVRSGTDTISTASGQIAAGNHDLSSRTEQQASSLEETASSMEEFTAAIKQNGDNARQANQLALSASEVAIKGGQVVSEVVDTMGSINESSKKIADIIGIIDGIAFQTNILALNAAVEAARAGEQGRGFAVVASEVRNLAQRSAAASKEIKGLIDDSVAKVGAGSRLVEQAGTTMVDVVASIKLVTDIMNEIAAANGEQSAGISQINQAITEMDNATQQNAALVEEATAAADSLRDQAENLAQVVSVFKLNGMHVNAVAPAVKRPKPTPIRVNLKMPIKKASSAKMVASNKSRSNNASNAQAEVNGGWEEF